MTIVGAGLAGSLLATLLARRGVSVTVLERRSDPRLGGYGGGRSINLALAERGLHGLRRAGLEDQVMASTVLMRGRQVHGADGSTTFQRYGRDDSEVIWSINRGGLNALLVEAAEQAGAQLQFEREVTAIPAGVVIGADGAGSAIRGALGALTDLGESVEELGHSYKELEVPPGGRLARFALEPQALHIWPRGDYMCIALPNPEGTFTVTLFLPNEGDPSFASIGDGRAARSFFDDEFPDLSALIPRLEEDFDHHPVGRLATLRLDRWSLEGRVALIGDAAHAMVPFHGQGMNCAFEDCVELDELVKGGGDWGEVFAEFERRRLPNSRAIQEMAIDNYREMRHRVVDPEYLVQRELELILAERHPDRFVPRYSMVMFRRVPYRVALERGEVQRRILVDLTRGGETADQVDLGRADGLVGRLLSPLS